jgi:hypothetical protein
MWLVKCAFVGERNFNIIKMHGTIIKIVGLYLAGDWFEPVKDIIYPDGSSSWYSSVPLRKWRDITSIWL